MPYKCSWAAQKILKARSSALRFIQIQVGASNSCFKFWHDPWLNNRPLLSQYPRHIIIAARSQSMAPISEFLHDGQWSLPRSRILDITDLRIRILQSTTHSSDHVLWDGAKKVSMSTIWNTIKTSSTPVPWFHLVWNSFSIPKCSFILWLALQNRLLTKDRMLSFSMNVDPRCSLCNNAESVHHLFSHCPYFDIIRRAIPIPLHIDWGEFQQGNFFTNSPSNIFKMVGSLFVAVAVHYVWKDEIFGTTIMVKVTQPMQQFWKFGELLRKNSSLVLDFRSIC